MSATRPPSQRRRAFGPKRIQKKGRGAGDVMVRQRMADAEAFTTSVRHWRRQVAAGLAERLGPGLRPGETLPDHAFTLELTARRVEAALEELTGAHRRYDRQTVVCHNLTLDADRLAAEEVYPRAVDLRRSLEGTFGKEPARRLHGFEGETATWREGLRQQVERALLCLEDPPDELPEPIVPHQEIDLDPWIRMIRPSYEELAHCLDALAREKLDRELLGDARRRAMKAFDLELRQARAAAEAIFTLAGLPEKKRRELRAGYDRRRLIQWARERRVKRRLKAIEAEATAGGAPATSAAAASIVGRVSSWVGRRLRGG